jgi:hypothetical protein
MNALEKLYLAIGICLTAIACAHEARAQTVMHVMVYNVQSVQPVEHAVVRMDSAESCAKEVLNWDGLSNAAGDRSEARCLEVVELSEIEK